LQLRILNQDYARLPDANWRQAVRFKPSPALKKLASLPISAEAEGYRASR